MPTEDLARRFGAKLRETEPIIWQGLPVAMANLLRAIAQAEQRRKDEESNSATPYGEQRSVRRHGQSPLT